MFRRTPIPPQTTKDALLEATIIRNCTFNQETYDYSIWYVLALKVIIGI